MDYYNQFSSFVTILKESTKLVARNPIPMFLVTTLSLLATSVFYSIFDFSAFSIMRDMLAKESLFPLSSSSSSEFSNKFLSKMKNNFPLLLATYCIFVLSYFVINLVSALATIIATSESYKDTTLSLKDLLLRMARSCAGVLVTGFYTTLFVIGYVFLVIWLATPILMSSSWSILGLAVLLGIFSFIVYLYLSVVWTMSLVVASVEGDQVCGSGALARSAEVVKQQRVSGFLVNVVINLVTLGVFLGSKMIRVDMFGASQEKISGLFLVNCSILVRIWTFTMYTILYFKGSICHGMDGIQLEESHVEVEYQKLGLSRSLSLKIP